MAKITERKLREMVKSVLSEATPSKLSKELEQKLIMLSKKEAEVRREAYQEILNSARNIKDHGSNSEFYNEIQYQIELNCDEEEIYWNSYRDLVEEFDRLLDKF